MTKIKLTCPLWLWLWWSAVFGILALFGQIPIADAAWKLVWSDEFNGNRLNESNWVYETGPWPTNGELQYYTNRRRENIRVGRGTLVIEARPEMFGGRNFTSGRLRSRRSFVYGKFEARARLPKGKNLWPAIWAFPPHSAYGDHPRSGEIDIMEMDCSNTRRISSSLHCGADAKNLYSMTSGNRIFPIDFSKGFHTFGFEWTRKEIRFLCDGKKFWSMNIDRIMYPGKGPRIYTKPGQPFDKPFFWVLNLAVGGSFFGPPPYIDQKEATRSWKRNRMEIDWIRNYRWVD